MDFSELPSQIKQRLVSLAQNHPGTSALDMFEKIPGNLRDSASEIEHWLDTHEWSHVIPKSMGGVEAIWETTVGNPNQVRGDQVMTIEEMMLINEQNYFDSREIENLYSDDISADAFDSQVTSLIPEWASSLDQALIGAGLIGASGYAVAFAFRVARNVIVHRDQLIKSREFRKSFLLKTLQQAHEQGLRAGALAFIVAFICIIFPPFKFLLFAGVVVGLGRLGVEILYSVVRHVDPTGKTLISRAFSFTREIFDMAASVFTYIWTALNVAVDWLLEGLKKGTNAILKIGKKTFQVIGKMMDWLLGTPTMASAY